MTVAYRIGGIESAVRSFRWLWDAAGNIRNRWGQVCQAFQVTNLLGLTFAQKTWARARCGRCAGLFPRVAQLF